MQVSALQAQVVHAHTRSLFWSTSKYKRAMVRREREVMKDIIP
jgi:hypothetical protein